MTVLRNSFNAGTGATTITTGNSGGESGDAFAVATGCTYDSFTTHSPARSALCFSNTSCDLTWNISASQIWTREYVQMSTVHAHTTLLLWSAANASGSSTGRIVIQANGTLQLGSAAATLATLSVALTANQWARIEGRWSTSSGCDLRLYTDADSDTPAGTATLPNNIASSVASVQFVRPSATPFLFWDDLAVSTEGWIGPAVDLVPRPPMVARTAVQRASRW